MTAAGAVIETARDHQVMPGPRRAVRGCRRAQCRTGLVGHTKHEGAASPSSPANRSSAEKKTMPDRRVVVEADPAGWRSGYSAYAADERSSNNSTAGSFIPLPGRITRSAPGKADDDRAPAPDANRSSCNMRHRQCGVTINGEGVKPIAEGGSRAATPRDRHDGRRGC